MPDPLKSLQDYLAWLEERGSLLRVRDPISPILEIPSFLRRVMYNGGPTVLFENVAGYPGWRVAGNIYQNLDTVREALGIGNLEDIGERLVGLVQSPPPVSLGEKISSLRKAKEVSSLLPRRVRSARFTKNIVEDGPLASLPLFKTWPRDGSRYITLGLVIVRDPQSGITNMGVYRVMEKSPQEGVVHWQVHKRGALAYKKALEEGRRLPIAIVLGSDPGTMLAGVAPVPYPMDKLFFAGVLRGKGVDVYELDNGIIVPANAEAVLEGYIEPGKSSPEGPFGDHWGFYDRPLEEYPVAVFERLYHRDDPVYPGTVVGLPPLEDAVIGKVIERVFLPVMKMVFPEIVDVNFPVHGVFQGLMIVSIKKRFPWHGKKVLLGLWGVGQTSLTKMIVVVDHFVDVHDLGQVMWAVTSFAHPARDIVVLDNAHTDSLDPTSIASVGAKIGIDATVKFREEAGRDPPDIVAPDERVEEKVARIAEKYGVKGGDPWRRLVREYLDTIRVWYEARGGSTP